jgi:AAA+ ATPase superfamily predicted ATPase
VPHFAEAVYPTWRALFRALVGQWPREDQLCPLVVDELPYLVASSPDLPSVLQGVVDDPAAMHLPLVLCGSSQRMMHGLVMDASAPLYGRAQVHLRLPPLPLAEVRRVFGIRDPREIVETYAAWGGIPRYWELAVRQGPPLWKAITQLVLAPSGVLHEEGTRVLRDEEAAQMERSICQAIGRGVHRPSEIAGRLGVPSTTLAKPLRHVVDLGLVRKDAPYDIARGRPRETARASLYTLADPFLSLWYRCVHPHMSGLDLGAATALRRAREAWDHHVASMWEALVRTHWHGLAMDGHEWEPAGRYWEGRKTTGVEWDVVAVTSDRSHVMLGDCKWPRSLSQRRLARYVHAMKSRPRPAAIEGRTVHEFLFLPSTDGLPRERDGVRLFSAADLMRGLSTRHAFRQVCRRECR